MNQTITAETLKPYLQPNREIEAAHPLIRQTAEEVTRGSIGERDKAVRIFYYVRDAIRYNMYPKDTSAGGYCASAVLQRGEGWCLQKSVLAASLYRASGIPAGLTYAEVVNHRLGQKAYDAIGTNHFSPHTFVEIYLNDSWIPVTPVFDAPLCAQLGVPAVEFDGAHPALLSPRDLIGRPYMEYLTKTRCYPVLYWPHVLGEIKRVYGEKASIWFNDALLSGAVTGEK